MNIQNRPQKCGRYSEVTVNQGLTVLLFSSLSFLEDMKVILFVGSLRLGRTFCCLAFMKKEKKTAGKRRK